jgi:hypothetical protein
MSEIANELQKLLDFFFEGECMYTPLDLLIIDICSTNDKSVLVCFSDNYQLMHELDGNEKFSYSDTMLMKSDFWPFTKTHYKRMLLPRVMQKSLCNLETYQYSINAILSDIVKGSTYIENLNNLQILTVIFWVSCLHELISLGCNNMCFSSKEIGLAQSALLYYIGW